MSSNEEQIGKRAVVMAVILFAAGLTLALVAAAMIFVRLFGEETFGIAVWFGWVGIGLIAISGVPIWARRRKPRRKPA